MKRELALHVGTLDLTDVSQEVLEAYDRIKIYSGDIYITPTTRKTLAARGATIHMASTVEIPEGTELTVVSGTMRLSESSAVPERTALMVNGLLILGENSEQTIAKYSMIIAKDDVMMPDNFPNLPSNIRTSKGVIAYPAGCTMIDGDIDINRRFVRGAKDGASYYTTGDAYLSDPGIDVDELIQKNITIFAKRAFISADYSDADLLFDARTEIITVPSGFRVIKAAKEPLLISDATAQMHEDKLFILGDAVADADSADALRALSQIIVFGGAAVHEDVLSIWKEKCQRANSVDITDSSRTIENMDVVVTSAMLEDCPDGVRLENCNVTIAEDAPAPLLAKLVRRIENGKCTCTEEQQAMLQLVGENVRFARKSDAQPKPEPAPAKRESVPEAEQVETVGIYAAYYKL